RRDIKAPDQIGRATHPFAALAQAGTGDDDETFRNSVSAVDGFGSRDSGLAPLARAVEDDAVAVGGQQEALLRVGVKAEATLDEIDDVLVDRLPGNMYDRKRVRPELWVHDRVVT